MDDRVHWSDRVDLVGDASGLSRAAKIADDHTSRLRSEILDGGRGALTRSRVQDDRMSLVDQRLRRRTAQAVRAASDKDARHHSDFKEAMSIVKRYLTSD